MRATSDLWKLRVAFNRRLRRIRQIYTAAQSLDKSARQSAIAFSVIELDNLVLSTTRQFTISTLRRARTARGHRIHVNGRIGAEEEIAAFMLSVVQNYTYRKMGSPVTLNRRQEPKLRDPRDAEKIISASGASNVNSVRNALALNTTLFSDLATLRNFYAHRNDNTWRKVKKRSLDLGIIGLKHPDEFVNQVVARRPVTIFEDWLDDAELFFTELTE